MLTVGNSYTIAGGGNYPAIPQVYLGSDAAGYWFRRWDSTYGCDIIFSLPVAAIERFSIFFVERTELTQAESSSSSRSVT